MLAVFMSGIGVTVMAQSKVSRVPLANSSFPISEGVWVGDMLYLSGMLDSSVAKSQPGDTETQTVHALENVRHALEEQHLSMGDVVLMHVYLAGDPAQGGKMDFAGFMKGYSQFFGTKDQPNKPARSAMQVAALALPGALVEIEVTAVSSLSPNPQRAVLGK
jgi:enamine deaminase RidA (YjgF/YER057c/UK114 family)